MQTHAVVLRRPHAIALEPVTLTAPDHTDVVVDVAFSSISAGTEKMLWDGSMPTFPGMGYPLVPGYETVGRVAAAGPAAPIAVGTPVFVPGSNKFFQMRGLFGGASARVCLPHIRAVPIPESLLAPNGVLLALAATAQHAIAGGLPDLIIGHGTLGMLIARLTVAAGGTPTIWERDSSRSAAEGYAVIDGETDTRKDYARICDASGAASLLDTMVRHLAPGGEIVLAGFYDTVSFSHPAAFMREMRLRIAAQFTPAELLEVRDFAASGALSLDGIITHTRAAADAADAYAQSFTDPACRKMLIDWRGLRATGAIQ